MVALNVVLCEPPGPQSCFVEVETDDGRSVRVGEWRRFGQNRWALRLTETDLVNALADSERVRRASVWRWAEIRPAVVDRLRRPRRRRGDSGERRRHASPKHKRATPAAAVSTAEV
jgi:hypothetical protein